MDEPSTLADRIQRARASMGWSQQELADRVGVKQQTIGKIESGITKRSRYLPKIARQLGLDFEELAPDYYNEEPDDPREPPPVPKHITEAIRQQQADRGIRVAAALQKPVSIYPLDRSDAGLTWLPGRPIGIEGRTAALVDADDAYGFYVPSSLMAPAIEPGDTVLVHPDLPPVLGADCVFLDRAEGASIWTVQIGRVLDWEASHWLVKQFRPEREFKIVRSPTSKTHRIVAIIRRQ